MATKCPEGKREVRGFVAHDLTTELRVISVREHRPVFELIEEGARLVVERRDRRRARKDPRS